MKKITKCRACSRLINKKVLLSYEDSPSSAQGFLDSIPTKIESLTLDIFECSYCGVIQHDLEPVAYHKNVIRAIAFSPEMYEFRKTQLSEWIDEYDLRRKRLLEIGSGRGEYIKVLSDCGANHVFGLEHSEESVLSATSKGHKVSQGYLDSEFKSTWDFEFDGFAIFSFLEHWPNPIESFAALHKIINQDAVGLIEVPNFEFILKNGLFTEFTPDHIFYFDINSLTLFLQSNGFEVISIEPAWHDYILSAKVRKRKVLSVDYFLEVKESLTSQLNDFLSRFSGAKVIWGAGHQALAVISMTGIVDHIDYVVDSATFKQGKYTPASHLLIKDPNEMSDEYPEAIVVMAAAYSSEILRIIETKFPEIRNVAVLKENKLEIIK